MIPLSIKLISKQLYHLHASTVNHWWCSSLRGTAGDASSRSRRGNNRSVMPLNALGRTRRPHTRYTERRKESSQVPASGEAQPCNRVHAGERQLQLVHLVQGIPSRRQSPTGVVYIPALCTHHLSLLPIEWFSEALSAESCFVVRFGIVGRTWSFRGSKSRERMLFCGLSLIDYVIALKEGVKECVSYFRIESSGTLGSSDIFTQPISMLSRLWFSMWFDPLWPQTACGIRRWVIVV